MTTEIVKLKVVENDLYYHNLMWMDILKLFLLNHEGDLDLELMCHPPSSQSIV